MKKTLLCIATILLLIPTACKKEEELGEEQPMQTTDYRFSVGPDKKVRFAPGNLQYRPSDGSWRFATQQYIYLGDSNSRVSDTYSGWIDLFAWGTGDNPTMTSRDEAQYRSFADWANHLDGNWRTLSADEWDYLLNQRPRATQLRAKGTVHREYGFILLPDGWVCPPSVYFTASPDSNETEYPTSQWKALQESGAVFIPAGGRRTGTEVFGAGKNGFYWTSTESDGPNAQSLYFVEYSITAYHSYPRYCGLSVRLARDE